MSPKILKNGQVAYSDGDAQVELRRRIEQRADELWVESGRPEGMALSHWLQAEREISAQVRPNSGQESPRTRDQSSDSTKAKIKTKLPANTSMDRTSAS